jgi:DNA polymerase elongation subunit (family B)
VTEFYTDVIARDGDILIRFYNEDGLQDYKRVKKGKYEPFYFVPAAKEENTGFQTIHGTPVQKTVANNISEFRTKVKEEKEKGIYNYKTYGLEYPQYLYIYENYKDIKPNTGLINEMILDIEVSTENGYSTPEAATAPITAITMMYPKRNTTFVLGKGEFDTTNYPNVTYIKCNTEREILAKYIQISGYIQGGEQYADFKPDVITGWNVEFYDIPYIVNRIKKELDKGKSYHESVRHIEMKGEKSSFTRCLSLWNEIEDKTFEDRKTYYPRGLPILDYLALYKKFIATFEPQETYKLDHIAYVELGERKLDYSEYGSLHKLFTNDHQKFIEYNIRDCDLIRRIDNKRKLLELVYIIAYGAGVTYIDALGTTRSWDVAIHNYLLDNGIVVSRFNMDDREYSTIPGGFVKEPIRGKHDWVVSFDLTSLYPHLIMGYNIGPDTFLGKVDEPFTAEDVINDEVTKYDYFRNDQVSLAGNGCYFRNDKTSFLSALMKKLFQDRKKAKNIMIKLMEAQTKSKNPEKYDQEISHYNTLQHSLKIRLNSLYGALANKYFRWFDVDLAEAITLSGQMTIKWAAHQVNDHMNHVLGTQDVDYIVAIDTDSIYVRMGDLVKDQATGEQFLDHYCENVIQPLLNDCFEELAMRMGCKEQAMFMKREIISDSSVFLQKKRYGMNVLNKEGVHYDEPKLKIMGIESVRSSTPSACREAIEETIRLILQEDEETVQDYIKEFRKRHREMNVDEIAFNSSANNLKRYSHPKMIYGHKTPIYVKGSLLYNHHRKKFKIEKTTEEIFEGEKIKWFYLREPNPIREEVISLPTSKLPEEFGLHPYIDYNKQFEKGYLEPVKKILDVIGWEPERQNRLVFE